ncbi:MAG: FAD-dependent monooxygenase [Mariprofundaceae bacterium]
MPVNGSTMPGKKKPQYDVLIAGGGLIGASLPLALAGSGLQVAVIEPFPASAPPLPERTIALSFGASRILQQLGIWSSLQSHAEPILTIDIREPGGKDGVRLEHRQNQTDALGYVIENHRLISILHGLVGEHADFICPARLTGLRRSEHGIRVSISDAAGEREIAAKLLIGADGSYSQVRRFAGIGCRGWDHNQFGIVASVTPERPHGGVAFECLRESGPLALLPMDEQRCSIVWTLGPAEAQECLELNDEPFMQALSGAMGASIRSSLGRIQATGPRACFPFELRQAASYTAERVALIGNAAHTLHPVAGQGLNLGMRDVHVLADVLRHAAENGRDVGAAIALAEYGERRCVDNAAVVAFTEGVNFIFRQQAAPIRLARAFGLGGMQRVPAIQRWLMQRASGLSQISDLLEEA